jgi:hypothetical protein
MSLRFNALIRTHHISSLQKIAKLRKAADRHSCFVILKRDAPGLMYCEGSEDAVKLWVTTAQVRSTFYQQNVRISASLYGTRPFPRVKGRRF